MFQTMSKNFLIILAVIVAILGGIFLFSGKDSNDNNSSNGTKISNHVKGQGKKAVTLLEYGDYQCPVCAVFHPVVEEIAKKYEEDIFFQFRNLPLTQIHQNAFAAARAAEAAAKQDKFWEMYDILFEQQASWSSITSPYPTFEGYAKRLGLDTSRFKLDYQSSEVNDLINADIAAFKETGKQQSTPAFFIDGKYIENDQLLGEGGPTVANFTKVIDEAIKAKSQ